ncbi:MAG: DegT/DnrJ/EryC1/StrS family aminotransferase [Armatimonadetes bacterium]|nr:DegT/DnrJ/EryC1/StrS family aminotransferase [Armatimonadota bacterium]
MAELEALALNGGPKVKATPYGTGSKHDADAEAEALRARLHAGPMPLAMGPAILDLRARLRELFGVRCAVPTSSGTAAVHAGLAALGVVPGDEVITTPLTDHGTMIGIMQLNAIPVCADVNPHTMMIDAETIAPHITPRTRVLLPVHLFGCPTDMDGIARLAGQHGLKVLEDCAQSWMAEWNGRLVGTLGHAGIFSINESKHISAGEGGVVLTDDEAVGRYTDLFVDKCYDRTGQGAAGPAMPALNYRMSEVNAVLAIEQLKRVRSIAARRYELGEMLAEGIEGLAGIRLVRPPAPSKASYWHGVLLIEPEHAGVDAAGFARALAAEGISAGAPVSRNILAWPLFQKLDADPRAFPTYIPPGLEKGRFDPESCPNANAMAVRSVRVRLDQFSTDADIQETIRAIRKVAAWYAAKGA